MEQKISFSLPGLYLLNKLNRTLIRILDERPFVLNDDVRIGSVYGSFPCEWNGGRGEIWGRYSFDEFNETVKMYNSHGIQVRLTFTNQFVEDEDLNDYIGNSLSEILYNNNEIINAVNLRSPVLWKYFEENFPKLQRIISTTLRLDDTTVINNYSDKYLVIPDYCVSNKKQIIDCLTHPENIEFLCAEPCHLNCAYRHKHQANSDALQRFEDVERFLCPYNEYRKTLSEIHAMPNYISLERIRNEYLKKGFNKFKISGRQSDPRTVIEHYVEYLIRPEYQDEIRLDLLNVLYGG